MEDYEFIVMLDFDFSNIAACPFKRTTVELCQTICERAEEKGQIKKVKER